MINITEYKENGFILLRNLLQKDKIQLVLNDAKQVFFEQFKYKKYTDASSLAKLSNKEYNECMFKLFKEDIGCLSNCGKQAQHLISLHQLSVSEKIIGLLYEAGLKIPVISTRPVLYFNHPKLAQKKVFHTVEAHQDWRSMQGSLNSVVIWIPLMDIDKSLGALQVLPGSHKNGLRTKSIEHGFGMVSLSVEEEKKLIDVEVSQGDILLFSSFLVHQSGENVSNNPRWSCHFRYNDLMDESFIKRSYAHPYIYKPQEELITSNFPSKNDINKIFNL
jgi:phytanoyl-CoA hydroxylase